MTNDYMERIVSKAKEIRNWSVEQLLMELFKYSTSLPECANYWEGVLENKGMGNDQINAL